MKKYEAKIAVSEMNCLRRLLGNEIRQIYSPDLQVSIQEGYTLADSYVFWLEDSFLEITNHWLETEQYQDYWKINVNITNKPNGIQFETNEKHGKVMLSPVSSIDFGVASPIMKMLVLEDYWQNESGEESILYDKAIVFYRQDDQVFSISAHNSIADFLEFTNNQQLINELVRSLTCRCVIEL